MKTKILATVSVIAIMASAPAMADLGVKTDAQVNTDAKVNAADTQVNTGASLNAGSDAAAAQSTGNVSTDVNNAWEDIKDDSAQAYENIKATLIDEERGSEFSDVTIDSRITASGMIGQSIHNEQNENIGTVKDIILDRSGKAIMVIVADGEFLGMGKEAAFDYNAITRVNTNGDVIMPLSEATIDNAAEFSYDREDYSETVRVIPSNGYSVAELLDAQLVDQEKDTVGDVDNISFQNGEAAQIIVGFDKVLGLGGKKAAMNFSDAQLIQDGSGYDFQLSANQSAQFDAYKNTN